MNIKLLFLALCLIMTSVVFAQNNTSKPDKKKHKKSGKVIFKDSLDGKFDVSNFLMTAKGFVPVPQIITEPALGHIGLMFTPVFIHPNKYQEKGKYIPPNITAGFVGYTANNTWGVGALRMASLPKYGLKYKVGLAHGNINMDFYREVPVLGEQKFAFNFKTIGVFASLMKEIGNSDVFVGLDYLFLKSDLTPEFDFTNPPDFIKEKDLDHNLSSVGIEAEYDKRDNVFTPNTGWHIITNYRFNANWTGSDYDYQNFSLAIFKFLQFKENWISGFRLETTMQFGEAPFYMEPSISLRGVPMRRYQGNKIYTAETEQRYDVTKRWSLVGFGGLAKATRDNLSFNDADLIYNYGTGFRYLIARKFKLRVGLDVAWSNNDFGYYVVFGSAWNNRN